MSRSVAIIGTRGYPSYYGGFETAVRKLAPYLADHGWNVTVYGRRSAVQLGAADRDTRIRSRLTPGVQSKSLSTISYGATATLDALVHRPDVALVMNVANGYFLPLLRARGIPSLVNVDGIEWERAKWSAPAKRVFRTGANLTARYADNLVFDARAIEQYWNAEFHASGIFIPYGGDPQPPLPVEQGLGHRDYVLYVARLVPENSTREFFAAAPAIAAKQRVVIVGSDGFGGELDHAAKRLASETPGVSWLGHISNDQRLVSLWQHAGLYFHGHSVGGTNPSLVQAMTSGAPILARDTVYNREVLGDDAPLVQPEPRSIVRAVDVLTSDQDRLEQLSAANIQRAHHAYEWPQICAAYEHALSALVRTRRCR